MLVDLFDWHIRWDGPAKLGGRSIHVGTDSHYVAVYSPSGWREIGEGPLNHIGVLVDDLDAIAARVRGAGLEPYNWGEYEPGRRFYFDDPNGIEFEVVSYAPARAEAT